LPGRPAGKNRGGGGGGGGWGAGGGGAGGGGGGTGAAGTAAAAATGAAAAGSGAAGAGAAAGLGGSAGSGGGSMLASFASAAAAVQVPPFLLAFLAMSVLRSVGDAAFAAKGTATDGNRGGDTCSTRSDTQITSGDTHGIISDAHSTSGGGGGGGGGVGGGGGGGGFDALLDEAAWQRLVGFVGTEVGAKHCLGEACRTLPAATSNTSCILVS